MVRITPKDFIGTRIRFTRIRDARIFSGWVESVFGTQIQVQAETSVVMEIGDKFQFEAHCQRASASFTGTLSDIGDFDMLQGGMISAVEGSNSKMIEASVVPLIFKADSPLRYIVTVEPYRVRVNGVQGEITVDSRSVKVSVVDVSESGFGFVTRHVIEPGTEFQFGLDTPTGRVRGTGVVRYSRPGARGKTFRCGASVDTSGRLDGPRWLRFVEEAA